MTGLPLKPVPIALAALALFGAVQTVRIEGVHLAFHIRGLRLPLIAFDGFKEEAAKARADLAAITAAQRKANAAQAAVNHEPAARSAAIARISDAQTPDYLRRVALAAAGHAAPVGRLCGPAAAGGPGNPDLPRADHAAPRHDDPAGSADMVSVARADWDKLLREAALRAELYQAGQALIAAGVAVAADPKEAGQ